MKKMLILSMVMAAASAASAALDTISIEQVPGTNAIALSWSTELRANYVLEDKTDLVIGDWETNTAIIALGDNITVTTAVDQAQSFYRVLETIPVYNFSFELGTLEAWTATGAAFSGQPVTTNWPSSGFDGTYLVNTFWDVDPSTGGVNAAIATGSLRSDDFVMLENELLFLRAGGWSKIGATGTPDQFNYVTLNLASDDTELDRTYTPGVTGGMGAKTLFHDQSNAVVVYVEVVDDGDNGWGWMSVDDFRISEIATGPTRNIGFELGNYTDWTVTGTAWGEDASGASFPSTGYEGLFHANSFAFGGPTLLGTLTSTNFTLEAGERLSFLMGGWSAVGAPGTDFCYATLNLASDGTELDRVWAPGITGPMTPSVLNPNTNVAVDVYVQVVDDSANGWAWLSVDEFAPFVYVPFVPDTSFGSHTNGGFELGDWTGWSVTGTAFGAVPFDEPQAGIGGWTGTYYALSRVGGEPATGTLVSETFSFGTNDTVSFLMGGWSGINPESNNWNYVALKRAFDDSEIDRVWAPNTTPSMVTNSFASATNVAEEVYIEIVDDSTGGGFSWLSADDFQIH